MLGFVVYIVCFVIFILGYMFYGRFVQQVFGLDTSRPMPCISQPDGVDYVPLPTWKVFLIQLMNIAGLGPVIGAVSGCLFGPVSLLWITLGCVFAGAMHDFLAAAMSAERDGLNLPELVGENIGNAARYMMRLVCIFLLLMVGVVFTLLPGGMLSGMFPQLSTLQWSCIILLYYFLATVLPLNAIIGKIYPFFGALFLFMALGLFVMLPVSGYEILPNLDFFTNQHPAGTSVWPMLFVTIACGAISGFHATQSPMMVRCLKQRKNLRLAFYGAMIVEGMVALIWSVVGMSLRDVLINGSQTMSQLTMVNPSDAVKSVCKLLLGDFGGMLAVLGVVVLAVTSGDTALRSCRLMLADVLHIKQVRVSSRFALAVPLFLFVIVISQLDFSVIWRYFGWGNQALACFTLWSIAAYLRRHNRCILIALLPALFMTCMCGTFLFYAPECGIETSLFVASIIGAVVSAVCLVAFLFCVKPVLQKECQ